MKARRRIYYLVTQFDHKGRLDSWNFRSLRTAERYARRYFDYDLTSIAIRRVSWKPNDDFYFFPCRGEWIANWRFNDAGVLLRKRDEANSRFLRHTQKERRRKRVKLFHNGKPYYCQDQDYLDIPF